MMPLTKSISPVHQLHTPVYTDVKDVGTKSSLKVAKPFLLRTIINTLPHREAYVGE
jgi:hypothetical protein